MVTAIKPSATGAKVMARIDGSWQSRLSFGFKVGTNCGIHTLILWLKRTSNQVLDPQLNWTERLALSHMSLGAEPLHSVLGDWVEYNLHQFICSCGFIAYVHAKLTKCDISGLSWQQSRIPHLFDRSPNSPDNGLERNLLYRAETHGERRQNNIFGVCKGF